MKRELITDVECYRNYFLVAMEDLKTGEQFEYSVFGNDAALSKADRKNLRSVLASQRTITFNGRGYDMVVMVAATLGFTTRELKIMTDQIIMGKMKPWDIERKYDFKIPEFDHIDIIEVAPGRASLKIYNGRTHGRRMQDLPYEHDSVLTYTQAQNVCDYCFNDLDATRNLFNSVSGQIELRRALSHEHGIDLRSKSDAQVAEAIIKKEMIRLTGRCDKPKDGDWHEGAKFKYKVPDFISFKSPRLKELLRLIATTDFVIGKGGYVNLPEEIKKNKIRINDGVYSLGIGGLHSNEKCKSHFADENTVLRDSDVTSYYPAIILALRLFPKQLGKTFLKIYSKIVRDRVAAKEKVAELTASLVGVNDPDRIDAINREIAKYQIAADGGKIMVNGSFGKFGSKYSILYSPPLLIQTTITGQLSLLMLIDELESSGIEVVSANTDGIVCKFPKHLEDEYQSIMSWWQKTTGFHMEFTEYKSIHSRDVNSYIAVYANGKVKTKGAYSMGALSNNPQTEIAIDAAIAHITGKGSIIGTIKGCSDIRKFVTVRTVNGGAIWPMIDGQEIDRILDGEFLGKAIRWYYAKDIPCSIHYKKPTKSGTHNRVPKTIGAKPCMTLPDKLPSDLDYAWYMRRAYEILEEVGFEDDPYFVVKKKKEKVEDECVGGDKYGIVAAMQY